MILHNETVTHRLEWDSYGDDYHMRDERTTRWVVLIHKTDKALALIIIRQLKNYFIPQ